MAETTNRSKKRPVEDTEAAAAPAATPATENNIIDDSSAAPPSTKKAKTLSKKELLLQAKLRLKEAQEKKKKALQERLEEEQKAKDADNLPATAEEDAYEDYDAYADEYYYDYHIPPVSGAGDSLLMTDISQHCPPEKVYFIVDPQRDCIASVLKVMKERKVQAAAAAAANHHPAAAPAAARSSPSPNIPAATAALDNSTGGGNAKDTNSKPEPKDETMDDTANTSSSNNGSNRKEEKNGNAHEVSTLPDDNNDEQEGDEEGEIATKDSSSSRNPKAANPKQETKEETAKPAKGSRTKEAGPKKKMAAPPPTKIAWKRGLAQITGKTLDCKLDLASKTTYIIRSQDDQRIAATVQFFVAPDNPKLLQHHPSKRQLQDHLSPVQRLSCNTTHAWKGQDIIDFLKRQTHQKSTTYTPPARRNLPMSHWALLEFQDEPLMQGSESRGYFTGMLEAAAAKAKGNNKNNKATTGVNFAGKLVWNMTDPLPTGSSSSSPSSSPNNANTALASPRNSKLSKWGEVVVAVPTTGTRNSALVVTIQGFYELPPPPPKAWGIKSSSSKKSKQEAPPPPIPAMPQKLQARKVILSKSRTIGFILGPAPTPDNIANQPPSPNNQTGKNIGNNNGNAIPQQFGCCHVLFPNGITSGSTSVQSLKGSRAILYD